MKQIVVIVDGSGQHHDLSIEPGTTTQDILMQLNLNGYRLSKDRGEYVFGTDENIYLAVADGEKLTASSKPIVGLPKVNNGGLRP